MAPAFGCSHSPPRPNLARPGPHAFLVVLQYSEADLGEHFQVPVHTFIEALFRRLAIPRSSIAVLGDMENDLAMFRKAGMSIAMGNATAEVKALATHATAANTEDGFAKAIDEYVLG